MATGEAYANQSGIVDDMAYIYVEDSSGGFKRMTKEQLKALMENSYTLPAATESVLGGIKAASKGDEDTVAAKIGALPWTAPTGAHDMYKTGEYMIYDGKIYLCKSDTAYSPSDYAAAWEEVE